MLRFMGNCVDWIFDNTDAVVLMNFVPEKNKPLKMLMAHIGSECMGNIKGSGADGRDEIMYCYYKDMR